MAAASRHSGFAIVVILLLTLLPATCCLCEDIGIDPPSTLSLKEIIKTAFLNNKEIQIQEEEVSVAKADILYARSAFLPKLNVNTAFTYTDSVLTTSETKNSRKDSRIFTGYKSDNDLTFSVTDSIYDGGANIANLEQARLQFKVQNEVLRAKKLDVEFDAKRLYYGLLLAYETERITQNLYDQSMAHYRDVGNKFDQGTVSKFDLLQSKVQVTKIMPELVKSRNAADLIKADLKKLI